MTSISTNQSFVQGLKVAQHLPPSTGTQTSETQSTTLPAEIENLLETLETSSGSGDPSASAPPLPNNRALWSEVFSRLDSKKRRDLHACNIFFDLLFMKSLCLQSIVCDTKVT